jgi:DNA-binding NarL/FixJ family response regulator
VAIRAALVVENLLRREGLRRLLSRTSEFEIFELEPAEPNLLGAIGEIEPQVVVADAVASGWNEGGGVELAVEIAQRGSAGVVLLGGQDDGPADARALFDLGTRRRGYLLESSLRDGTGLVEAIKLVAVGGSAFEPMMVDAFIAQRRLEDSSPLARLTGRELEVLSEIAAGWGNAAIASSLGITKRAVERHISSIFRKCAVSTDDDRSPRVAVTLLYLDRQL